jgi:hypothetical protein
MNIEPLLRLCVTVIFINTKGQMNKLLLDINWMTSIWLEADVF